MKFTVYFELINKLEFNFMYCVQYIKKKAKEWNVSMDVKAELKFDLPRVYRHQKLPSKDIAVDFIRFEHIH